MVGSKDSISACNVVLNTITAEAFKGSLRCSGERRRL